MKTIINMLAAASLSIAAARADVPNIISHQGRVSVQGLNFNGLGQFKFVIYEAGAGGAAPVTARWSNSSISPANTNEPASSVLVTVSKGLFTAPLGDTTLANMAALPKSLGIPAGRELFLRIWFNDGSHGFQALMPDSRILSVPFAMQAGGFSTEAALGLGTTTPLASLDVLNGATNLGRALLTSIVDGQSVNFDSLGGSRVVAVRGNLMAVSAFYEDAVTLLDISNPAAPVFLSKLTNGAGFFTNMDGCYGLAFKGNLLAVSSVYGDAVMLLDVSTPAAPVFRSQIRNGVGGVTNLDGPYGIAITNNLMAVGAYSSSAVNLFDISNPSAPVLRSSLRSGVGGVTNLGGAYLVTFVDSNTLAAGCYDGSTVSLIKVTNPQLPAQIATLVDGAGGFNNLGQVGGLAVNGNLMAVSAYSDAAVTLVDISNPATPVKLSEILRANYPSMGNLRGVALRGNRLAIGSYGGNAVLEFDITDRSAPRLVFEAWDGQIGVPLLNPYGVAYTDDGSLVVAAEASSRLLFFGASSGQPNNVGLVVAQRLGIGIAAPREALDVAGNALIDGDLNLRRNLTVGGIAYKPGGGSWTTLSDARFKTVEQPFTRGLDALAGINPVTYHYTADNPLHCNSEQPHIGVLAQEIERVVPEAVTKDDQGVRLLNNDPVLWTMLNAIKELKAENDALRSRLEKLERKDTK